VQRSGHKRPVPATRAASILDYIKQTWAVLTRSNKDLAKAAVDPKFQPGSDGRWPVYIPSRGSVTDTESAVRKQLQPDAFRKIVIRPLPEDLNSIRVQGLLYLPEPYVVPGGRF